MKQINYLVLVVLILACVRGEQYLQNKSEELVIVGAGLSGLNAAYNAKLFGSQASVYEARKRLGGRTYSTLLDEGDVINFGGTLIDTDHEEIQALLTKFGLEKIRVYGDSVNEKYNFEGKNYSWEALSVLAEPVFEKIKTLKDKIAADGGDYTGQTELTSTMVAYDKKSISECLSEMGAGPVVKDWVRQLYAGEYGFEPDELNCLHLLELSSVGAEEGESDFTGNLGDEKYTVKGGLTSLTNAFASRLGESVQTDHKLTKISKDASGHYVLNFQTASATKEVTARKVILALPLSVVQKSIDIEDDVLKSLIKPYSKLRMGANDKFFLVFKKAFWQGQEKQWMELVSKEFDIWSSPIDATPGRVLTVFRGGEEAKKPVDQAEIDKALGLLRTVFGASLVDDNFIRYQKGIPWAYEAETMGSYAGGVAPGHWQDFAGLNEPCRENICLAGSSFAGKNYVGFMEGALRSGRLAAEYLVGVE